LQDRSREAEFMWKQIAHERVKERLDRVFLQTTPRCRNHMLLAKTSGHRDFFCYAVSIAALAEHELRRLPAEFA